MIIVHGRVTFQEAIADNVRAQLSRLARAVRERHPGNIDYRFSIDAEDARVLRLTERWDELASFESHGRTPEVDEIGALIRTLNPGVVELKRYEVASEAAI